MALELNNAVTEFDTLFECVVELHKFSARNLDNMRGGENVEDPDFLASVSLCRLNVQDPTADNMHRHRFALPKIFFVEVFFLVRIQIVQYLAIQIDFKKGSSCVHSARAPRTLQNENRMCWVQVALTESDFEYLLPFCNSSPHAVPRAPFLVKSCVSVACTPLSHKHRSVDPTHHKLM